MKKFLLTTLGILVLLNCNNLSIASDEHYFYVKNDNYSVSSNSINDINNINKYYSFISYICDEFSILQKLFHQTNFDTIIITHKTMLDNNLDKIIDYYSCYFSAEETNIRKLKQLLDKYNYKDILNNIKIKGPYFVPYQFINEALTKKLRSALYDNNLQKIDDVFKFAIEASNEKRQEIKNNLEIVQSISQINKLEKLRNDLISSYQYIIDSLNTDIKYIADVQNDWEDACENMKDVVPNDKQTIITKLKTKMKLLRENLLKCFILRKACLVELEIELSPVFSEE